MAGTVKLTLNFKDGTSQTVSRLAAGEDNDVVCYDQLTKSLNYVQEQSNAILTTVVNQEKKQQNRSNTSTDVDTTDKCDDVIANGESEDETEEEDEDEDKEDGPPLEKRLKT